MLWGLWVFSTLLFTQGISFPELDAEKGLLRYMGMFQFGIINGGITRMGSFYHQSFIHTLYFSPVYMLSAYTPSIKFEMDRFQKIIQN